MPTPPAEGSSSPILGPSPAQQPTGAWGTPPATLPPRRRPVVVILAVLLMVPSIVTWLIAGFAFFRAMLRSEGDGLGRFLVVCIGAGGLGIALLVVLLGSLGMLMAWVGDSAEGLAVPAGFTFGLFVVVIVVLLVQGKLSYHPTMVTPLVVGGLAGVSLALIKSPPARAWFTGRRR
ncbi:hypothetical protein SAMN05443287_11764 [Micromonospora phaseoli]|uniref:Uncharacterized protein n=1 Tax=Micromonospora phaseoli TaxID=1144548 RepID=A0A1H7DTY3_9ACTN|nr:hypothetical protein [Micromonospora phaseoli]PZV99215.1 hypothetical protein CLV64_104452 [Micromonospora phaseoli]GIJ79989.1 hypothetical protein Xph01_44210 [Micromonospora phaseoli]SEK04998.1 hypothetical protein SAMN05443287_11764 [Micromonospora phaseoli]